MRGARAVGIDGVLIDRDGRNADAGDVTSLAAVPEHAPATKLSAIARLFVLRPFFTLAVFGIPVIILVAVGLITIWALKLLVFVVLPIVLVVWVLRKLFGKPDTP